MSTLQNQSYTMLTMCSDRPDEGQLCSIMTRIRKGGMLVPMLIFLAIDWVFKKQIDEKDLLL